MKYTEKSQTYIDIIDSAIFAIRSIYDDQFIKHYCESNYLISNLEMYLHEIRRINSREIDREFWDLCSDVDKIKAMKRVFEIKFSKILSWRDDLSNDLTIFNDTIFKEVLGFVEKQSHGSFVYTQEDVNKLMGIYWDIVFRLSMIKRHIKDLLIQWENMSMTTASQQIADESVKQILEFSGAKKQPIKLNSRRKTDVIKILSAMYDAHMFAGEDGKPLTNKQKLMESFGEFLDDDFSAYSASLSQAKTREDKTFLRPFKEIEKEAIRYFNEVVEK